MLETSEFSGGYILGFRVEALEEAYKEIVSLFSTYSQCPIFGVDVAFEDAETEAVSVPKVEDNLEIVDTGYSAGLALAHRSNYAVGGGAAGEAKEIIFSEELGLAVERPPKGLTIEQLWKIV